MLKRPEVVYFGTKDSDGVVKLFADGQDFNENDIYAVIVKEDGTYDTLLQSSTMVKTQVYILADCVTAENGVRLYTGNEKGCIPFEMYLPEGAGQLSGRLLDVRGLPEEFDISVNTMQTGVFGDIVMWERFYVDDEGFLYDIDEFLCNWRLYRWGAGTYEIGFSKESREKFQELRELEDNLFELLLVSDTAIRVIRKGCPEIIQDLW